MKDFQLNDYTKFKKNKYQIPISNTLISIIKWKIPIGINIMFMSVKT